MKRGSEVATTRPRREVLHTRVYGSSGQESSLAAREEAWRATSTGEVVKVVQDRGGGLRENRPGVNRLSAMVCDGTVTVVRVIQEDRLARFVSIGSSAACSRCTTPPSTTSLITIFAGRAYGMRLARARARLLAEIGHCGGTEGRCT
ncbi:hypothetical protein Aple_015740 [Acrocarpospora pleiomorpha]|uniref:Resolvase/invertase-type recombinase catalytic domain-containing protein n=1 Tax=Acrocarpospora pleiomorpha TaxID=90975 RepID=A0A5M3XEV4_9ACTN|nr:recombinase family protein [Acrocarpospora pleiomorpha]GES18679.1 hypothetical protein Aple_015740 [Acrocarpospora pleiomorpha]